MIDFIKGKFNILRLLDNDNRFSYKDSVDQLVVHLPDLNTRYSTIHFSLISIQNIGHILSSVSDPHKFLCGSGSGILIMSIRIRIQGQGVPEFRFKVKLMRNEAKLFESKQVKLTPQFRLFRFQAKQEFRMRNESNQKRNCEKQ